MSVLVQTNAFSELVDEFSECFDAESVRRLTNFQIGPKVLARIEVLAEKANEGQLTDDERSEYQATVDTVDLISIITLKAEQRLKSNGR